MTKPIYTKPYCSCEIYYSNVIKGFAGTVQPETEFKKYQKLIEKYDVHYCSRCGITIKYGDRDVDYFKESVENIRNFKSKNKLTANKIELINAFLLCKSIKKFKIK